MGAKSVNIFWGMLEPLIREPALAKPRAPSKAVKATRPRKPAPPEKRPAAPARAPRKPPVKIPEFKSERQATQGAQLWDLRGRNNFRQMLLVKSQATIAEFSWPEVLSEPGVFPGSLLNTLNFLVEPPRDLGPRRFRFLKRLDWEQIFMEEGL